MGFQEYRKSRKKHYLKKYISLPLVTLFAWSIILFPGVNLPAFPQQLSDVEGHWAEAAISQMAVQGFVKGFPDGTFRPDNNISRAEFAALTVQAFAIKDAGSKVFSDTAQHWAGEYIASACAGGIVKGYSDDVFGPDDLITREQMALMVSQAAGLQPDTASLDCSDGDQVADWAKGAVAAAYERGIISGMPDGSFRPQEHATRAQAVIVLSKSLDGKNNWLPEDQNLSAENISINSISIKTAPKKTAYTAGDKLDLTGLVITLMKSDGAAEDISLTAFPARGITAEPAHGAGLSAQDQMVSIFIEGKTVTQKISVSPAVTAGGGGGGGSNGGTAVNPIADQITWAESAIIGYVFEVKFNPGFKVNDALITYTSSSDPARRSFFASTAEGGNVYRYLADDVKAGDSIGFYVGGKLEQTINIAVP